MACVPFFERLGRIARAANDDEITHHKHDVVSIFYDLDAATMILVYTLDLGAELLRGYDLPSEGGGVVTTCPSFTGNVGPGLKDVRTTPSLPSRR